MTHDSNNRMQLTDITDLESPWVAMMVGTPASGKSTLANGLSELLGAHVYSADDMREKIAGDVMDQSVNSVAWQMVYGAVEESLGRGESCVVDGTHANAEWRMRDASLYRGMGAKAVVAIHVLTSLDTAIARNRQRPGKQIPNHAMVRIHKAIAQNPPQLDTGFDGVITIDNEKNILA